MLVKKFVGCVVLSVVVSIFTFLGWGYNIHGGQALKHPLSLVQSVFIPDPVIDENTGRPQGALAYWRMLSFMQERGIALESGSQQQLTISEEAMRAYYTKPGPDLNAVLLHKGLIDTRAKKMKFYRVYPFGELSE
ncbi:hypothetical protein ACP9OK_09610 [Pseudomonas sp. B11]